MNSHLKTMLEKLIDAIAFEMANDEGILDDDQPDWVANHWHDAKELLQTYLEHMEA